MSLSSLPIFCNALSLLLISSLMTATYASSNALLKNDTINYYLIDKEIPLSAITAGKTAINAHDHNLFIGSKNSISEKLQGNFKAPIRTQGTSKLTLKLDKKGNVLFATASGSNATFNRAAEKAAFASSPLPIDFKNPEKFTNLIINFQVE